MEVQACINHLIDNLECKFAVISPGSRNAPLIYALSKSENTCFSVVDERSAGFVALGIAKQLRQPVILCCTSGTAAANYYPAIIEAFYARVPLIVITADRPPEQIDAWDGQAIRQKNLYRNHIRAEFECPDRYDDTEPFTAIAHRVNKCWNMEVTGPIHINVPIREPFYQFESNFVFKDEALPEHIFSKVQSITLKSIAAHVNQDFSNKKVLVFNGMDDGEMVVIATSDDSVMLSDVTSNQTSDIHYWDALLFVAQSQKNGIEQLKVFQPDILITTGTTTVSKGLKRFLQYYPPASHYHISSFFEVGNMFGTGVKVLDPHKIEPLDDDEDDFDGLRGGPYVDAWLNLSKEFETQFASLDWKIFNEFTAMNYCINSLPHDAILHLGNSMPVRYASFLLNSDVSTNQVFGNRGTSGIDGCISTAIGNALSCIEPVYVIVGDVTFFYDLNALNNVNLPPNLKIIILNNYGGGIFELISGPDKMGEAIGYQTTNHKRTAELIAQHYGVGYKKAFSLNDVSFGMDFLAKQGGCAILEIITDREQNAEFFKQFLSVW